MLYALYHRLLDILSQNTWLKKHGLFAGASSTSLHFVMDSLKQPEAEKHPGIKKEEPSRKTQDLSGLYLPELFLNSS